MKKPDDASAGHAGRSGISAMMNWAADRRADEPTEIIEEAARASSAAAIAAGREGVVIGAFKLVKLLGQGGFGEVWQAEQSGHIRRMIALKLIKPGMASADVMRRFETERQALAVMDHPNIARVFDAGATPEGSPWFAMELVDGCAITTWCDERRLPIRERLQLFLQVCAAVQHAHQKGVLHRDLKPSNILVAEVDGRPVPKVIDFGIAKAMTRRHGDSAALTFHGQLVGTPQYMSPEQVGMEGDVDTRSDVYSLGVVLYELLTGYPPVDPSRFRKAALDEICRVIREEEPPKPSTRIAQMAARLASDVADDRKQENRHWTRELIGDLDWIIMRALDKERDRRYAMAQELAEDIERHLRSEPVRAGPPGGVYRLQKFVKRNRATVLAGVGIAAALVVGAAVSLWQARRAGLAERIAKAEAARADTQRRVAEATSTTMSIQASAASLAMAKERIQQHSWPDGMAYVAASLRAWPANPAAASLAADLLFDRRAFCADVWIPDDDETIVSAGYPTMLVRLKNDDRLQLLRHGKDSRGSWGWTDTLQLQNASLELEGRGLVSPGGRFVVAVRGDKVRIIDLAKLAAPAKEVPLVLSPLHRKTSFSENGSFLVVASDLMAEVIDLVHASKHWTFSTDSEIAHIAIGNDGSHAATVREPVPVILRSSLAIASGPTGELSRIPDVGGGVIMASGSADCSLVVVCTRSPTRRLRVFRKRVNGESRRSAPIEGGLASSPKPSSNEASVQLHTGEDAFVAEKSVDIDFNPLVMRMSEDGVSCSIIGYENETRIRIGSINLTQPTMRVQWHRSAQAGPGLYWERDPRCYGFAARGEVAVLTAHSSEVGNRSSVFCFGVKTGELISSSFAGRVVSLATADHAPVLALTTVAIPPSAERSGSFLYWRANVVVKSLRNLITPQATGERQTNAPASGSWQPILENVRVQFRSVPIALSPEGRLLALSGPHSEQTSIIDVRTGKSLGFLGLQAEEKQDLRGNDKLASARLGIRTYSEVAPVSVSAMAFNDETTLSVFFSSRSRREGMAEVSVSDPEQIKAPWNDLDRPGMGQRVLIKPLWIEDPQIVGKEGSRMRLAGWCPPRSAVFTTDADRAFSYWNWIVWHAKEGPSGMMFQLEDKFDVTFATVSGDSRSVLIAGRPRNENVSTTALDGKNGTPSAHATAFVVWCPNSKTALGASKEFTEHPMLLRMEDEITCAAFGPDSRRFILGHESGALKGFTLPAAWNPTGKLEELSVTIPPTGSPVASLQLVRNGSAVCATYKDSHFRIWNLDTDVTFSARLGERGTSNTSEPISPQHLPALSRVPRAEGDRSAESEWPGRREPPKWLAEVLERCAGKAVMRFAEGDWNLEKLTPPDVSGRRLANLTGEQSNEPWSAWMRWIEDASPTRSAFPGIELSEALRVPRAMIDFPSSADTIPIPRRLSIRSHRPSHWLVAFELAAEAFNDSRQTVTTEVENLIEEGNSRIAALPENERPLCWAAAAYYVAGRFPPDITRDLADRAVRLAPNDPEVQLFVGFAMLKYPEATRASYEQAVPHFRKAVETGATPTSLYWLARGEASIGDLSASLKHYQQALASGLNSHEWAVEEYATVLLNNGAAIDAAALLQTTGLNQARKPGESKGVHFARTSKTSALLAVALWRSGREAEAQRVYLGAFGNWKFPFRVDGKVETPINQALKDIHAEVEKSGLLTK